VRDVLHGIDPNRKRLYILCVSILPLMICTGMVYVILSVYMHDELEFSKTNIGILFALGAGTGVILAPFIGKASDKFGRKPVLAGSALAFLTVFTMYSIMTEEWQFVFIMMAEGTSWIAIGTAAAAYIADISLSTERGRSMGVYEMTWNFGWVLGPLIGGILSDIIGFQKTFLFGASIIIISVILIVAFTEETAPAIMDKKMITADIEG